MATYETAIRDGEALVAWAEPNAIALADELTEAAVLRALSVPVPPELAMGVPLLRYADGAQLIPLIEAIMDDTRHRASTCDRCEQPIPRGMQSFRLMIPEGASAVAVQTCGLCHDVLNDVFGCGLVWS